MASEVPASDILCQAAEYLSRLGSNLRIRSDNLRENKMRKDKLKNLHSVHKAAKKILLICELSKKSLEHVEKGVQNILSIANAPSESAAAGNGGKSKIGYDTDNNKQYQKFKYCSHTLRICKTVSVNHYMSAKVYARKMSLKMQDKYPVYFDCKLYRSRQRREKINIEKEIEIIKSCKKSTDDNVANQLSSNQNNYSTNIQENDTNKNQSLEDCNALSIDLNDENKICDGYQKCLGEEKEESTAINSENSKSFQSNYEEIKKKLIYGSDSSDSEEKQLNKQIKSKHRRIIIPNESFDDSEENTNLSMGKDKHEICIQDKEVIPANSKSPLESTKVIEGLQKDVGNISEENILKCNEQDSRESIKSTSDKTLIYEPKKPLIKCVNIHNLLKPDLLNNLEKAPDEANNLKDLSVKSHMSNVPNLTSAQKVNIEKTTHFNKKMKEARATFQPKSFKIKLYRLPTLTKEFLQGYKLKKITYHGSTICKLALANDLEIYDSYIVNNIFNGFESNNIVGKRLSIEEVKNAKYALINESDSDNADNNSINISKSKRRKMCSAQNRYDHIASQNNSERHNNDDNICTDPSQKNQIDLRSCVESSDTNILSNDTIKHHSKIKSNEPDANKRKLSQNDKIKKSLFSELHSHVVSRSKNTDTERENLAESSFKEHNNSSIQYSESDKNQTNISKEMNSNNFLDSEGIDSENVISGKSALKEDRNDNDSETSKSNENENLKKTLLQDSDSDQLNESEGKHNDRYITKKSLKTSCSSISNIQHGYPSSNKVNSEINESESDKDPNKMLLHDSDSDKCQSNKSKQNNCNIDDSEKDSDVNNANESGIQHGGPIKSKVNSKTKENESDKDPNKMLLYDSESDKCQSSKSKEKSCHSDGSEKDSDINNLNVSNIQHDNSTSNNSETNENKSDKDPNKMLLQDSDPDKCQSNKSKENNCNSDNLEKDSDINNSNVSSIQHGDSTNSKVNSESKESESGKDLNKMLLQDSDSDKCQSNKSKEKNYDSDNSEKDSDTNNSNESSIQHGDSSSKNVDSEINVKKLYNKSKKMLLEDSDSDNHQSVKSKEENDDDNKLIESQNDPPTSTINSEIDDELIKDNSQSKIKSSLMSSSEESQSHGSHSLSVRRLRRKRIRQNIKAKKKILAHSSSSEDDLPNRKTLKKKNVLTELSDELEDIKRHLLREQKKIKGILTTSSSSDDDLFKMVKRKKTHEHSESSEPGVQDSMDSKGMDNKAQEVLDNDEQSSRHSNSSSSNSDSGSRHSDSSSSQMVRSKAKPGNAASSHNSDTQDDKDIDRLINMKNLENAHRRRSPTSKADSKKRDTVEKSITLPNAPSLLGEEILKAESSDESNSGEEVVEELPAMLLPGVNNGIGHMAKDDLLGESDSSLSHNDKGSENTQDDTDEENVKSRRRKANAISSDSEVGATRHKNRDVKLSDFEDSEGDSSEPKKTKRTKKVSDSEGSGSSSDTTKKKRRRIKQINDSDVSDSDGETEGRNKHGRKNIRKVMGKNQLEEATKKAAREEKERIARIAERQKLYNNMEFDESGKPDEVVLEKVVLDFDPETKEPLIEVDRGLVKKLKPHQANGIKFMWDACFESVKRIKKDKGSGCILAHCMGLGKTLQVISLTHTLLTHNALTGVNRVLVVCPLSTVLNWVNEFRMWLKHAESEFEVDVYELSKNKQNMERASQMNQWFEGGGVCVLGYEMFRNLSADNNKKFKKKMLKSFQESLVDPGPDLVVCDEGHLLKNEKTSLSQSMNRVKTRRRIVLTGTPLQNNLKEYYCMVQFVKPNLLGKYNEYLNRFVNPITNGQYTDSTEHDIRVMKRRSHVLHKMLDGAVQRRDYGVLAPFLPPKHEYVLFITLSDVQIKLYQHYLDNYSRRPQPGKSSGFLFPDFQSLQRIWTHPLVLKYNSERYEILQQKKREREEDDSEGSLVDFIDDDSTPEESSTEESTDDSSDEMSDDSRKKSKKKKSAKKHKGKDKVSARRGTRANPVEQDEDPGHIELPEVKYENPTEWWIKLVTDDELEDMRNSHKLVLLFDILRQCEAIGDKLLVFSQSLYSLDLIEHFLGKVDEATQEGRMDEKLGGHLGSWSPGIDYFRLDGSTSCENRSIWCKNFNREDNPRARLFLISTRAGGLGINLVAANRVVIFDVSWNPSHDVQSIFRVYRFGQKKPCYVYRFLAMGTMEEKIYERQVTKQAISKRVIDEQQIDRHYAENDLAELYRFEPKPIEPRELPALPKDRLFAEMLREHEAQIYKYHEHDSLLENKEEETLTEEERKAAWEDFENEKNRPPPAPFPTAWPNGMMPNLLMQQQQTYAMLAAMIRKDMPTLTDNQIRDMLPLLYNAPGIMQKMNEVYKYAQPGMLNPMMSTVMNPAAGSGLSGASGLQYEPPWQRQHQQQMRLQQLLQQQSSMGAKYYSGGLGSRDPVAMALQQQRAREIMLGGGGGGGGGGAGGGRGGLAPPGAIGSRPRGRPPMRPRADAPAGPADVVNLDSD